MNDKPNNQAEEIINSLKGVFELATTSFEEFYKKADKKESGNSSQSASSGNSSQSASSGYSSQSASSGYSSQSASSGNYSQSASSGYSSQSASSGYSSQSASSGYSSQSASSGNYSQSASSGYSSQSASSGNYSQSASSGNSSQSASSGNSSQSASSGYSSQSASSGYSSQSASSGNYSQSASSGYSSQSASSGNYSQSASSGNYAACSSLGYRAAVNGAIGNLIMTSEYAKDKKGNYVPVGGKADIVDGKKLKAGCWYIVEGGKWVEVDFTDNIFSYVLSTKSNVKKVKDDNGKILYIVTDGVNNAHGKTIKEARDSLIYKISSRDTSEYKKWKKSDVKPLADIIKAYRAITGACEGGVRSFVEGKGKMPKEIKISDVFKETKGAFGAEVFKEFFK